ncbi:BspA family leucine-rich repeat surface protein [Mycoplasma capricolum subsp. capripneumoniae]|uniref:BspA family leucine-rich repeat surface protein n=1 Tax=Mycoplasma capricolum TaxID=2095 RepID=UPI0004EF96E9|nr:BspA family leucine-rich repeat surface protein [Mycoplasma capricolum]QIN46748.1 BspA family leucine-rich repeat surface protein [Mycoplasma capricolum subsp. capripneumoniae]QIN47439.1 BspA family leucine-rich repeat surface protein [Mycoplasma capricolum subsp. capripneumoniae]QIN50188.1 BspA family leucine-rich repeat surface protein [Mycoplasma capricolum subsp. capripneumoniae]CEA12211.1 hypothetical protein MCCPF38_00862 [Mycoplasma capricolum subsp. capripneumoniae]
MKKLLTILTTSSAVFLITAGVMLSNKNSNKDDKIAFNQKVQNKEHVIEGGVLKEVGYYKDGNKVRIKPIRYDVTIIDAELPKEITSLKNAFSSNKQMVKWIKEWDTQNITDMSGVFYKQIWVNDQSIKKWNTSNVTDMSEMFYGAESFNQDLSSWDVSKVENMNGMFDGAVEFNNGNKHLEWENKLDSVKTMKKMFNNAPSFKHSLKKWKMPNVVNHENFGLETSHEPEWKIAAPSSISVPQKTPKESENGTNSLSSGEISKTNQLTPPKTISESPNDLRKNNLLPNDEPNVSNFSNRANNSEKQLENSNKEKNIKNAEFPNAENKVIEENNNTNSSNDDYKNNLYKIPSKPNTIISKSNSPNAGIIAGAVLGSFTIIGTGAGLGYYYRKNLKNLYLKSADKIKPSLLKSKDNIKDLYVKSKNKIKDKIAKIKSKK